MRPGLRPGCGIRLGNGAGARQGRVDMLASGLVASVTVLEIVANSSKRLIRCVYGGWGMVKNSRGCHC